MRFPILLLTLAIAGSTMAADPPRAPAPTKPEQHEQRLWRVAWRSHYTGYEGRSPCLTEAEARNVAQVQNWMHPDIDHWTEPCQKAN